MLSEARRHDPEGTYEKLDLRSIGQIGTRFDGVHASGCLYHITRAEFEAFLRDVATVLTREGVFYLNMKLGSGEEVRVIPSSAYPGGLEARQALVGERYYCYYSHEELLNRFAHFRILRWRQMLVQLEGVNEYWLLPLQA
jgi:cyclopropane fatty-acyl-phospholipid synthase-like methyltransferase